MFDPLSCSAVQPTLLIFGVCLLLLSIATFVAIGSLLTGMDKTHLTMAGVFLATVLFGFLVQHTQNLNVSPALSNFGG